MTLTFSVQETLWAVKQVEDADSEKTQSETSTLDAVSRENVQLNRYMNVSPFDYNRVKIARLAKDYINASFVNIDLVDQPYILTQGPLPNTVSHFWAMVWEQKTKAIVMLNRLMERNQVKCHKYWPDADRPELNLTSSGCDLKVNYVSEIASQHYIVRNFILTDLQVCSEDIVDNFLLKAVLFLLTLCCLNWLDR
jgi:tyrosine-protein phosphatase non-receptor type 1